MRSATHSWLGLAAEKSRSTRSPGAARSPPVWSSVCLPAADARQGQLPHQPLDRAAGHRDPSPPSCRQSLGAPRPRRCPHGLGGLDLHPSSRSALAEAACAWRPRRWRGRSATAGRSARPEPVLLAAMSAVELRPEERRRGLQDPMARPARGSPAPGSAAAGARRWSALGGDHHRSRPGGPSGAASRASCRTWPRSSRSPPLPGMLVLVLEHHADGPLRQLLGGPAMSGHGSNLSRVGTSRNPAAVQPGYDRDRRPGQHPGRTRSGQTAEQAFGDGQHLGCGLAVLPAPRQR